MREFLENTFNKAEQTYLSLEGKKDLESFKLQIRMLSIMSECLLRLRLGNYMG